MKWKKSGIIGNENAAHNSWYIRKDMGMNIISEYLKQSYHMPKRQLKTIRQGFWVEIYKRRR